MKKLLFVMVLALLVSFPLHAVEVTWGGLFYNYAFWWMNADFDSNVPAEGTDGDMHYYMHADINATADFGDGVTAFVKLGDWGNYGKHPITGVGPLGTLGMAVHIMAAYISAQNLFDSPIGITAGIIPVTYDDIANDGGEDGFTGIKLNVATDMLDIDLFSYRCVERGGMGYMMMGTMLTPPPDIDLHGVWATVKLPDVNIEINGFGFLRPEGDDKPMWVGVRSTGSPIEGLSYVGDFAMMMGSDETTDPAVDYSGMYFSARASYVFDPVTFGGGYYSFSGDDATTAENEDYQAPTLGTYANGYYKGWPGFGTAYTLWSPYGFNLVLPGINLNVINGNIGF
ncbi:MAG: hypothetical protein E3J23_04470, partial [Candidatus Stahlbacteria bacterium]